MTKIINKTLTIKGVEYKITCRTSDWLQSLLEDAEIFDEVWIMVGTGNHPWGIIRFPFSLFDMRPFGRRSITESKKDIKMVIKESIPHKKARKIIYREVLKAYSNYLKLHKP